LKRGEIWTISGGADYTGKPRPAIIIQSDKFDATDSIVVCPLTTTEVDAKPARFAIAPSQINGLQIRSYPMVDKISSIPKTKMGRQIGRLEASDVLLLNQHVILVLGLAEQPTMK
jgi:mRNA interferase MazF